MLVLAELPWELSPSALEDTHCQTVKGGLWLNHLLLRCYPNMLGLEGLTGISLQLPQHSLYSG